MPAQTTVTVGTAGSPGGGQGSTTATYTLDSEKRVVKVKARLGKKPANHKRSGSAQRKAGGKDRKKDDDGGHFIAHRFGGSSEEFNHFAQNRNFNRGSYRSMEREWAQAQKEGKTVDVEIIAHYPPGSKRPDKLKVRYSFDGKPQPPRTFRNRYGGR